MDQNVTSMLSGVPGSNSREALESSLLTIWPFRADRPGASTIQFFYADIYSIMKSLLKIKSERSRGWTYSHFIDKTRQRHIFRSSEFLWSQPIKHWLWTIFKHGIWWNKPLFDWNFVFGKKKNILSGLGLRVSLHSKAATEASKEITKLPPKYIAEPFPTDFNASGNSKYAVLQILSAHCQL